MNKIFFKQIVFIYFFASTILLKAQYSTAVCIDPCEKQPLTSKCPDLDKEYYEDTNPSYVYRYYSFDNECYSYVYSFCGVEPNNSKLLKTRAECEEVCLGITTTTSTTTKRPIPTTTTMRPPTIFYPRYMSHLEVAKQKSLIASYKGKVAVAKAKLASAQAILSAKERHFHVMDSARSIALEGLRQSQQAEANAQLDYDSMYSMLKDEERVLDGGKYFFYGK